jgi:hypothetical protein
MTVGVWWLINNKEDKKAAKVRLRFAEHFTEIRRYPEGYLVGLMP